jgi:ABC-type multidrug transport system permease subunit
LKAVLLVLVLSNLYVAQKNPARLGPFYVCLVLFLLANYFFPWAALPFSARSIGILLSITYAVPVFFAGVIFTSSFSRNEGKSAAFGANIVGAVAGGLAQNVSFILGMKALLIFASVFYILAKVCNRIQSAGKREVRPGLKSVIRAA